MSWTTIIAEFFAGLFGGIKAAKMAKVARAARTVA